MCKDQSGNDSNIDNQTPHGRSSFSSMARDYSRGRRQPTSRQEGTANRGGQPRRIATSREEHRRLADEFNQEVGEFVTSSRYVCRSLTRSRGKQATCLRKMRHNQE